MKFFFVSWGVITIVMVVTQPLGKKKIESKSKRSKKKPASRTSKTPPDVRVRCNKKARMLRGKVKNLLRKKP